MIWLNKLNSLSLKLGLICLCFAMIHCNAEPNTTTFAPEIIEEPREVYEVFFNTHPEYISDGFDFPVGTPNAKGYYNAQKFGENNHLGDDWNGTGGGNSDLGDAVASVSNGYVREVYDAGGGWGNIVRIIHMLPDSSYMESLYAHLDTMLVNSGDGIKKGSQLGTIGNANGAYLAHLHLEIRDDISLPLGGGYSQNRKGYVDPTSYIEGNRRVMWKRSR